MPSDFSPKPSLGRLEKIDPSYYWQNEDTDFIPWLAQAENLKLLGDAIGLDLEVVVEEQWVGTFQVDLLCRDTGTNDWVLIETQLIPSDAQHLGQVLTYAAGLQASHIIWITSHFLPEHRVTLDWLNQVTREDIKFFGLEIELWQIGNSAMAAQFNMVSQPQEWSKTVVPVKEEPLTAIQQQNLDFWSSLSRELEQRGSIVKPGAPPTKSVMGFGIGRADFRLYTSIDREQQSLHTELHLSGEDAQLHFHLLADEQEAIEGEMGFPLIWDDKTDNQACSIYVTFSDADLDDVERWSTFHKWFCDCLERFHEVFARRIKYLDANDYQPLPDYSFNPLQNSLILPN